MRLVVLVVVATAFARPLHACPINSPRGFSVGGQMPYRVWIQENGRSSGWFAPRGSVFDLVDEWASLGAHFELVGQFPDGRIETIYESVNLGPDVPRLGFTAGMPVSKRGFAALLLLVALALIDFRRVAARVTRG